jgi:hypothetical protein
MYQSIEENSCNLGRGYGLNVKCPPQAHVLGSLLMGFWEVFSLRGL